VNYQDIIAEAGTIKPRMLAWDGIYPCGAITSTQANAIADGWTCRCKEEGHSAEDMAICNPLEPVFCWACAILGKDPVQTARALDAKEAGNDGR